jgi:hypothetical protein
MDHTEHADPDPSGVAALLEATGLRVPGEEAAILYQTYAALRPAINLLYRAATGPADLSAVSMVLASGLG